jgi:hypothetical protein
MHNPLMKPSLFQVLLAGSLLGGVGACANSLRYDFIGSTPADWLLFAPGVSSRPILNTTAPGSILDDPTTTFWNRTVNPSITVDGRFAEGYVYHFTGRLELGNGVFGQYFIGEANGSSSGLLVNFENHPEPDRDVFAVGSLGGGSPLVLAGLNFNGALSYDFTLTLQSSYGAEVTGRISDSTHTIWDSNVQGPRGVLLDQPVQFLNALIAMSDGASAFNIHELSWNATVVPEPSAALLILAGICAVFTVRKLRGRKGSVPHAPWNSGNTLKGGHRTRACASICFRISPNSLIPPAHLFGSEKKEWNRI